MGEKSQFYSPPQREKKLINIVSGVKSYHLKSRILRPCTSKTPSAPFTRANAKLSDVSSWDPSVLEPSSEGNQHHS